MAPRLNPKLIAWLIIPSFLLIFFYSTFLLFYDTTIQQSPMSRIPVLPPAPCNLFRGQWILDSARRPLYDSSCPFHRNAWNCIKNQRENMGQINSWKWVPENCELDRIDPVAFLDLMRNKNIGFVGDSLNENLVVSFLCILRLADAGARKWKRKGAWRGVYFPKYNVTVAYHRAVLLAKYEFQAEQPELSGDRKGIYRVDVDIPAGDWSNIADFYNVLIFNTGHWWGYDKFPKETPLLFFKGGQPILPPPEMLEGFKVVVENMVAYIEKTFPPNTIKFWRMQSPRHFHGGDWNRNGSCLIDEPLQQSQLDLWFDPINNGVNLEARKLNHLIEETLKGTSIRMLDLTHLSEFRADAHPSIWLGKKDAVAVWGQDCMHWCLPGVPDTWVDIITQLISYNLKMS